MSVPARAMGPGPETTPELPEDAVAFVRFCRERRRVAWPELYDEMCAVARRRLYRGWGLDELAEHGVEFGLFQLSTLAAATRAVIEAEAVARCAAADPARPVAEVTRADADEGATATAA